MQELVFTSAPKGLKPGSFGFCTVAATEGMNPVLSDRLETLSGYRPLYPLSDPKAIHNPIVYAHRKLRLGADAVHVLSRIRFAGPDYTGRAGNKLAHHIALTASDFSQEKNAAGPAWLLRQTGLMLDRWIQEPSSLEKDKPLPQGDNATRICRVWDEVAGDPGWGGRVLEAVLLDPSKPVYVIYEPGCPILAMFDETISLLPQVPGQAGQPSARWNVTFNTYHTGDTSGVNCTLRGCIAGSPAADQAVRDHSATLIVDLTKPLPDLADSRYITAARTGEWAEGQRPGATRRIASIRFDDDEVQADRADLSDDTQDASGVSTTDAHDVATPVSTVMPSHPAASVRQAPTTAKRSGRSGPSGWFWLIALLWPFLVILPMTATMQSDKPKTDPDEAKSLKADIAKLQETLKQERLRADAAEEKLKAAIDALKAAPAKKPDGP